MSFKIGQLKFIDSFQFMASSLEKLTENLYDKDDRYKHFHNMKKHFNKYMDLLCRKGYYPYEYIDNDEKLDEIGLPPKEAFYSNLTKKDITDEEYQHVQDVYTQLNCQTFYDYHVAYLQCDVLLLSDIFENFR
jgi:hypothetical protein